MTKAQAAAWTCYQLRLQGIFELQNRNWSAGYPTTTMLMDPPTKEQVAVIESVIKSAVKEAQCEVISAALGPLVDAIDACDNNRPKAEFTKALRKRFQAAYDTLHEMKRSASATADPAVPNPTENPT